MSTFRVLIALFICLLASNGNAYGQNIEYSIADFNSNRPELGKSYSVIGFLQSWVGECINLEGSEACFVVEDAEAFPFLRTDEARNGTLLLRVKCLESGEKASEHKFNVEEVSAGPTLLKYFAKAKTEFAKLSFARQMSLGKWSLQEANNREPKLEEFAFDAFQFWLSKDNKKTSPEEVAQIFELASTHLRNNRKWEKLAIDFATTHSRQKEIRKVLHQSGFRQGKEGWQSEDLYLYKLGMVKHQEKFIPIERKILLEESRNWLSQNSRVDLLRKMTSKQYLSNAKRKILRVGMNRAELKMAWGFPKHVSWMRLEKKYFEAWRQGDKWACLVDGFLISWGE